MLLLLLSLSLGASRVCTMPAFQNPADQQKSLTIGPSGSCEWRADGSMKNAVLDCPGIDPTGATYSDAGINACILASAPSGDASGTGLYFPKGHYKLANPINLTHRMLITGDGMMNTQFYPDPSVTGFIVHYPCEDGHSPACDLPRSDLTVLRDIGIEYAVNASPWQPSQAVGLGYVAYGSTGPSNLNLTQVFQVTTAGTTSSTEPTWGSASEGDFITDGTVTWHAIVVAGVRFNARAALQNVFIDRCTGNGLMIEASTPYKNANSWNFDHVYVQQSILNGMYVQGADSNAGTAYATHSGSNRLWGIYDNSFLGNTYTACSTEANGLGAYAMVGVAATNILNGCYSEGGQPASRLEGFSMSFGGLHGAGFSDTSGGMRAMPGNRFETSHAGITFRDQTAPSGAQIQMPYASDYLMNLTNTVEGDVGFTIQAGNTPTNQGWWNWRHANLDGRSFMRWGGSGADDPYNIWFPAGLYIANRSFLTSSGSAPSWSANPKTAGSLSINQSLFPQSGFNAGIFGWQQQGNNTDTPFITTLRWSSHGNANEKDLTTAPSGSAYAFNWTTDSGVLFTNLGATAKQYIALPAQAFNPDLSYTELYLFVDDADGLRVTANGNYITYGSQVTALSGYLESTTVGSWLKLKASRKTGSWWSWNVAELSGTWTDGTQTFSTGGAAPTGFVHLTGDTMTGPLIAASGITVATGPLSVLTSETIAGTLGVTGAVTMASTLNVTGVLTAATGVKIGGALAVTGNATIKGGLSVDSGAVNLSASGGSAVLVADSSNIAWTVVDTGSHQLETFDTNANTILFDWANVSTNTGWDLACGGNFSVTGDATFNGNVTIQDHGQVFFNNSTNGENIITLPTGQTQGLVINDKSGQWYGHFDTQNQTFNFDVVSGYNGDVYFNTGAVHWNGSHLANILVVPNSDTDALDVKDTGGTYLSVYNTVTKGIAMHATTTNDSAAAGYVGEHLQDFVYAVSGPTGTANGSATTKTVFSRSVGAGDWMVRATLCVHDSTGSTSAMHIQGAISETTNSLGSSVRGLSQSAISGERSSSADDFDPCVTVGPTRVSLSGTTTEYAVIKWVQDNADVAQLYGGWEWWRVR